jgi:hypothetical protein
MMAADTGSGRPGLSRSMLEVERFLKLRGGEEALEDEDLP